MTPEQLSHYLKGGIFTAIFNPRTLDIAEKSLLCIGKRVEISQNCLITPIVDIEKWNGQFRFNCDEIYGWSPEEDFESIEITDEFIDFPEKMPQYMYRLHYTDEKQLKNFGNGKWKVPMVVSREYTRGQDDYVRKLSEPPATMIEKFIWNGETIENIKWKEL